MILFKTGKTWRERVEREVGGGIGMGNTCKPMAVSFQCMTKFTTNKKKNKKKNGKETVGLDSNRPPIHLSLPLFTHSFPRLLSKNKTALFSLPSLFCLPLKHSDPALSVCSLPCRLGLPLTTEELSLEMDDGQEP